MARTRSPEKKEAILDAVAPLVESEGYNKTRIEHVAAAAGVGKQTIYRWWPTKPDLMAEAYARMVPSHELASGAEDPRDALTEILRNAFRIFRRTPASRILAGLIADAQSEPAAAEALYNNLLVGRRGVITASRLGYGHSHQLRPEQGNSSGMLRPRRHRYQACPGPGSSATGQDRSALSPRSPC